MPSKLVATFAKASVLVGAIGLANCAARAGTVPMAGHRNSSTTCVFGLRGVRVAVEDEEPEAVSVRLTMCSDLPALRERTRAFLAKEAIDGTGSASQPSKHEIQLGNDRASASVEDIRGGVRIRVVPDDERKLASIRDEIDARVAQIYTDDHCD